MAGQPCVRPGCDEPRYQTPAGQVRPLCRQHEAERFRELYAAKRGGVVRAYRRAGT